MSKAVASGTSEDRAWVRYELAGGALAEVAVRLDAPWTGPTEVSIVGGPLTTSDLRAVPLSDARKVLRRLHGSVNGGLHPLPPPGASLLRVAVICVNALQRGESPAEAIASDRGITKRTAEGCILLARREGYLTPAIGKRPDADLTPYALRLLGDPDQAGYSVA